MIYAPTLVDALLALAFGLVIPILMGIKGNQTSQQELPEFSSHQKRQFYIANSIFLFAMAFLVVMVWLYYQRSFDILGFKQPDETTATISYTLLIVFASLYFGDLYYSLKWDVDSEDLIKKAPFMPTRWSELPSYLVLCISAGVFEEVVFRGFLIPYVHSILQHTFLASTWAVVIPTVVFSLAHMYQGKEAVLKIGVFSLLFGLLFFHSGSLLYVIIVHTLIDLIGGLATITSKKA